MCSAEKNLIDQLIVFYGLLHWNLIRANLSSFIDFFTSLTIFLFLHSSSFVRNISIIRHFYFFIFFIIFQLQDFDLFFVFCLIFFYCNFYFIFSVLAIFPSLCFLIFIHIFHFPTWWADISLTFSRWTDCFLFFFPSNRISFLFLTWFNLFTSSFLGYLDGKVIYTSKSVNSTLSLLVSEIEISFYRLLLSSFYSSHLVTLSLFSVGIKI